MPVKSRNDRIGSCEAPTLIFGSFLATNIHPDSYLSSDEVERAGVFSTDFNESRSIKMNKHVLYYNNHFKFIQFGEPHMQTKL